MRSPFASGDSGVPTNLAGNRTAAGHFVETNFLPDPHLQVAFASAGLFPGNSRPSPGATLKKFSDLQGWSKNGGIMMIKYHKMYVLIRYHNIL